MAQNQKYSNSQYADKYYKRPPSPNPFKEKVRNPREVRIGINGTFQFTHNGIPYYTKKGLKYDMIFPEISSYTTLRCLGLKPKVTFLIDKKTGRQGIETKGDIFNR